MMKNARTSILAAAACLPLLFTSPAQAQQQMDLDTMSAFLQLMNEYMVVMEMTHSISSDPEKAAILQMQKIQETYEARGEKARSADVFREVLESSSNQTVRNAAYVFLGTILRETGRTEEAIEIHRAGLEEALRAAD